MKQLVNDPKEGGARVVEAPEPQLLPGCVLVRTAFSAVSPGSERNASLSGLSGALRAVRERPDLLRRALRVARREGVRSAAAQARARLSSMRAPGSSSSGVVLATGDGARGSFHEGDRVACFGTGHAAHAEVACVPADHALRVPDGVALEHAAFGMLGAIALHAAHRARPEAGERMAVIGLGLIGQLTAQLLTSRGTSVAAYDLVPRRADLARSLGAALALAGSPDEQAASALAWSGGAGVDAVLVCAQTSDPAVMLSAARMCRRGARIVAVGLVPFSLPREIAYEKELDLLMSRSAGEAASLPRRVGEFLALLADGRVRVGPLIESRVPLAASPGAVGRRGDDAPVGIVIEYASRPGSAVTSVPVAPARPSARPAVAAIGAGLFARGTLLPELSRQGARMLRVVTATGPSAIDAARAHGFERAGTDVDEALGDASVDAVVIATRHDTHASLAARALRAGRHVLVEKPLAMTVAELDEVADAARSSGRVLVVGHNRRFAPLSIAARAALRDRGPVHVAIRVAAPELPSEHWLLDPRRGGGRLVGEGGHFVDLASMLSGDPGIARVERDVVDGGFALQLRFDDGSLAQILYTTRADVRIAKERVEAHAGGVTVTIDDHRRGETTTDGRSRALEGRGKGHAEEVAAFLQAAATGQAPVPLEVTLAVSRAIVT